MKLTTKIKKQIDDYFNSISPEELIEKLKLIGWEFEDIEEMNKIKTTDDFVDHIMHIHDVRELLIAFAQYHVERALNAAAENAKMKYPPDAWAVIDKESILNSYPKENIK